jgi:hypothetical protein
MANQVFKKRQDCVAWLRANFGLDSASPVAEGALAGFADACEDTSRLGGVFEAQLGRWVIRDEDLKLFATVRDVITPMAAAGYVLSSLPAAGVTGVVLAVIDLLRKARRFGAWLTPPYAEIVAVLRAHSEPLTPVEILRELPHASPPWTEQMVGEALAGLREIATKNGPVVLVQQTHDGKWCLSGV